MISSFLWGGGANNKGIKWLTWNRMAYSKALAGCGRAETCLPKFSFYHCPISLLPYGVVSWIQMGRSLLIRDRELVSSGNFIGRVGVFSGALKAEGCLSDYGIRRWTSS
ncbi:hypothetical protein A2U01_0001360, partial [Trifolium medium]|nr:hypothetical protein [Trifolium medium]